MLLALTYVMPSYSVLRRTAKSRDDLELVGLRVEGTAQVPKGVADDLASSLGVQAGQGELQLSMAVSMRVPGRCRIELSSVESTKSVASISNNGRARSDGTSMPAMQVLTTELCAVLALRGAAEGESRVALEKHLSALKVDIRLSSLGRFAGKVAYIIGDPKPGAATFWAYKDKDDSDKGDGEKLRPARVKFTDEKGQAWDVRLMDYSSLSGGDLFPRVVEIYLGDALQLRLTTQSADAKVKLDDKLF